MGLCNEKLLSLVMDIDTDKDNDKSSYSVYCLYTFSPKLVKFY